MSVTQLKLPMDLPAAKPTKSTTLARREEPLVLLSGPHDDLADCCSYVKKEAIRDDVLNGVGLYELSQAVERMLESKDQSVRLSAMHHVLEKMPDCGMAHVAFAREGAGSYETAEHHYRQALPLLRREFQRLTDPLTAIKNGKLELGPYLLEVDGYILVAAEFARFLWTQERPADAIEVITSLIDEFDEIEGEHCCLAVSWLIQTGSDAQAHSLMSQSADDSAEWHYMNALLQFRAHGDTPLSRAALRHACLENRALGRLLLEYDNPTSESDDFDDLDDDEFQFAEDTRCAWHNSSGSEEWLYKFVSGKIWEEFANEVDNAMSKIPDLSRIKRWRDNFDLAQTFIKRDDLKEAKRLLRMALREAEKLGPRSVEFYDTVDDLIAVLRQTGSSFEDIVEVLERQTAAVESLYSSSPRNKAFNLYRLATYFNDLSKHDRSADLLTESLRIFEHLMQSGDLTISLMEVSGAAHNLGFNLGELRRFEEAEKLFRRSLEIKEQYLGKDHPDQQYSLDYLMRCLHHLGNHAEEAAVRNRLSKLTSGDDYDPHKTHGPSCPWYLSECPA